MINIILHGAYGRAYGTRQDCAKDWLDGKDFRLGPCGPYCSIRDLTNMQQVYKLHFYVGREVLRYNEVITSKG